MGATRAMPLNPKSYTVFTILRYILTAGINTAIGLVIILSMYKLTKMPYITVGGSAAIGYAYSLLTYHNIAFRKRAGRPPYLKYGAVYISAFTINSILTWIGLKIVENFMLVQIYLF